MTHVNRWQVVGYLITEFFHAFLWHCALQIYIHKSTSAMLVLATHNISHVIQQQKDVDVKDRTQLILIPQACLLTHSEVYCM